MLNNHKKININTIFDRSINVSFIITFIFSLYICIYHGPKVKRFYVSFLDFYLFVYLYEALNGAYFKLKII